MLDCPSLGVRLPLGPLTVATRTAGGRSLLSIRGGPVLVVASPPIRSRPTALPVGPVVQSTLVSGLAAGLPVAPGGPVLLPSPPGRSLVSAPGASGVLVVGLPPLLGGMAANVEVLLWVFRVRRLPSAVALLLSVGRRALMADPAMGVLVGALALLRVEREHRLHGRKSGTRRENTFTCSAAKGHLTGPVARGSGRSLSSGQPVGSLQSMVARDEVRTGVKRGREGCERRLVRM